ncbi:MAG TPA: caspase family protein, partial [Polyangia bacterium]|nr:caspase family protein [Polyangia bacterium]
MTRTRVFIAAAIAAAGAALAASPARAAQRVAVIIGNNVGDGDDVRLRYAEDDADKVHRVLRTLGGFRPEDMVLLRGESTETVRRALIRVNDRMRTDADQQGMLVVYYSGHADVQALHLGGSAFSMEELEALVRGSPARTRVLIVDACRSGALTRVKGAVPAPAFDIQVRRADASEGAVFLTSSSANEDAQESDGLRGSFFTHYLVSGLIGAADADGDRRVTLAEAYEFAYHQTLFRSARASGVLQRPTAQFDLREMGPIVLTTPTPTSARLLLPQVADTHFLVYEPRSRHVLSEAWSAPERR